MILTPFPGLTSGVLRREANRELVCTVGRAVEVIEACTSAGIAVLGIEVFPGLSVSAYDSPLKNPANQKRWTGYVRTNQRTSRRTS